MFSNPPLAVVTGAARGLGRAMCERLLHDGFRVEGWDLKAETTLTHANFRIRAVNVASEEDVTKASNELIASWGLPQALVNNAGITRDKLLHKMTLEDFEATWKVNVVGTYIPTRILGGAVRDANAAAQKEGKPTHFARILMLSSVAGLFGNVGQANYAASKAAVVAFAKTVAKEWGRFGISTLAVAPGFMKTDMTDTVPEEIKQAFIERTPLKRMGEPHELAAFVSYLCKPESAFLTGDVIAFSGGLLL